MVLSTADFQVWVYISYVQLICVMFDQEIRNQERNILLIQFAIFQAVPSVTSYSLTGSVVASNDRRENDLVAFLQVQLAEAINLQDKDLIAQLHETIRCLRQFDNEG